MKAVSRSAGGIAVAGAVAGLGLLHTGAAFPVSEDPIIPPRLASRYVTANGDDLDGETYDYIVVGGGLAGLTVAARLSEDADVTVAVIEAGQDIYGPHESRFLTPSAVLYDSFLNTEYDWKYMTTPQAGLNQRATPWARGKVLGGSSSVNSMYMVRASAREFDSWGSLIGAPELWGWDSMFAAMKKSEDFEEPVQAVRDVVPSLSWNPASHGTGGNIKTGWSGTSYPFVESFLTAVADTGTPISNDPDAGETWGAFLATSAINPENWHRSSSRTGYLDGIDTERANLHVLVGHQATKVLLDTADPDNVRATGVQYAASANDAIKTVNAAKEVIISGGTINSPQLLQHSGIGDAAQLSAVGIEVKIDLPGVGHNVQDHISAALLYPPTDPNQQPPSRITGDAITDSFVQSAIAYINLTTLIGGDNDNDNDPDRGSTFLATLRNNLTNAINSSPAGVPDAVKRAWVVTYTSQVDKIYDSPVGLVEILLADIFGTVNMQVALQQPLSRGSILVTSPDPFAPPAIDPRYLTLDVDMYLLREGHKLARRIAARMGDVLGAEAHPGTAAVADDDDDGWEWFIRENAGTEYHPSSSCSMLPRDVGGVVDGNLLVYGTGNLRVVDASIAPTSVSAHLMTATYGIAEVGADIIKNARKAAKAAVVDVDGDEDEDVNSDIQQAQKVSPAADGEDQKDVEDKEEEPSSNTAAVAAGGGVAAVGSIVAAGLVIGRTALRRWQGQKYSKIAA
ncbi:GMC oxidoreductase [Diaporthe helianthi]|uniref:GMC oxidoreductase n=1 Tax=Diaporthe helianthi TaxID=158607 RepID=A0A2P5I4K6_DIAHE|nr:GMC oxidoreductase [Diaporthe helianthi]